jgi:hypothetical protein
MRLEIYTIFIKRLCCVFAWCLRLKIFFPRIDGSYKKSHEEIERFSSMEPLLFYEKNRPQVNFNRPHHQLLSGSGNLAMRDNLGLVVLGQ